MELEGASQREKELKSSRFGAFCFLGAREMTLVVSSNSKEWYSVAKSSRGATKRSSTILKLINTERMSKKRVSTIFLSRKKEHPSP